MSYFKTVNLNSTAAAVYRANEERKKQEQKEQERLEHWQRLRVDYPAIERARP